MMQFTFSNKPGNEIWREIKKGDGVAASGAYCAVSGSDLSGSDDFYVVGEYPDKSLIAGSKIYNLREMGYIRDV